MNDYLRTDYDMDSDITPYINGKSCLVVLLIIFIILIIGFVSSSVKQCSPKDTVVPTVDTREIDSIIEVNHKTEVNIVKIDSIKNEKIKEVKHYNNDSTLELFKELVSE